MAKDPLLPFRASVSSITGPARTLELISDERSSAEDEGKILDQLELMAGRKLKKSEKDAVRANVQRFIREGAIDIDKDGRLWKVPEYYREVLSLAPRGWPMSVADLWRKEFKERPDTRHPEEILKVAVTEKYGLDQGKVRTALNFYTRLGLVERTGTGSGARYQRLDAPLEENPKMSAARLIARCQRLWTAYYNRPTKARLLAFGRHLERMKDSRSVKVKAERTKGLRAYNAEFKAQGWQKPKANPLFGNKYKGHKLEVVGHPTQMGVYVARWHHPDGVRETLIESTSPDKARKKAKAWVREGAQSTLAGQTAATMGAGTWREWAAAGASALRPTGEKIDPSERAVESDWKETQRGLLRGKKRRTAKAKNPRRNQERRPPRRVSRRRAAPRLAEIEVEGTRYDPGTGVVVVMETKPWTANQVANWSLQYLELGHQDAANEIIRQYVTLASGLESDARKKAMVRQGFSETASGWASQNPCGCSAPSGRRRRNPVETAGYYQDEVTAADEAGWLVTLVPGRPPVDAAGQVTYPVEVVPDESTPEGQKELQRTIISVQLTDPNDPDLRWRIRSRYKTKHWQGAPDEHWWVQTSEKGKGQILYNKYFRTLQEAINELRRSNGLLIRAVNFR